jgi:GT2 family glycosyltransferase
LGDPVLAPDGSDALVTVVVVAYQAAARLPRTLDAVAAQRLPGGAAHACWVVDNASDDGTADLADARGEGVRVLRSPVNLGFAGGNNLALRTVASPFVVLLNDDAVPEPGWLAALLAPFADASVAAVAGKLVLAPRFVAVPLPGGADRIGVSAVTVDGADVTRQVVWDRLLTGEGVACGVRWCRPAAPLHLPVPGAGDRLEREVVVTVHTSQRTDTHRLPPGTPTVDVVNSAGTLLTRDCYAADRGFGEPDGERFARPVEVFGGCGAALALRMSAVGQAGLFDDAWFLYYEDVDLCWRLRRHGWRVLFEPRAVARHEHSASVGTRSELHLFHDGRNRLLTLVKNASWPLVARTVGRYPLTTVAGALRTALGSGPGWRVTRLRVRVLASFVRLLPSVLARRRAVQRSASVPRAVVEAWVGRETGEPG